MISAIVAHGLNREIGKKNSLLWIFKEDLQIFKKITDGKYIVMGRKTFFSIKKNLGNRILLVLSKTLKNKFLSINVIGDYEIVLEINKRNPYHEIIIIGGSDIYELFLPFIERLYISKINSSFTADRFFPEWNVKKFKLIFEKKLNCKEQKHFNSKFQVWDKINIGYDY